MADLKPCPFCGGGAFAWHCTPDGKYKACGEQKLHGMTTTHYLIECKYCGIRTKVYASKRGAFNAWNRRAEK